MPELPEVESVVRGLRPDLEGRFIDGLELHWAKWLKRPSLKEAREELTGQKITAVERRGKYIVFKLSRGGVLISHLRMTGRWLVDPDDEMKLQERHKSATLLLRKGHTAVFYDVRKFGRGAYCRKGEPIPELEELGPEPLDPALTVAKLHAMFQSRRRDLKALLLDQTFLAGLGNIYVSEILHVAKISPFTRSDQLTKDDTKRFLAAMRKVLQLSIKNMGTTVFDYRGAKNKEGGFQHFLQVYGRSGKPCRTCGATIHRAVQGQRATYFCPVCQGVPASKTAQVATDHSQKGRRSKTPAA